MTRWFYDPVPGCDPTGQGLLIGEQQALFPPGWYAQPASEFLAEQGLEPLPDSVPVADLDLADDLFVPDSTGGGGEVSGCR